MMSVCGGEHSERCMSGLGIELGGALGATGMC